MFKEGWETGRQLRTSSWNKLFTNCSVAKSCLTLCNLWPAARQASLSFTISQSLSKLMSTELMKPSNHLIFGRLLFLLPSIFPRIRVFSKDSALHIRWLNLQNRLIIKYCTLLMDIHLEYTRISVSLQENDGQSHRKMGNEWPKQVTERGNSYS